MNMTLRSAASALFGAPPMAALFGKSPAKMSPPKGSPAAKASASAPRIEKMQRIEPVMREGRSPRPGRAQQPDLERILEAAQRTPVGLDVIDWAGDDIPAVENGTVAALQTAANDADANTDQLSHRIRERYLTTRFPGVVRTIGDLDSPGRVIKAARLYFEDGEIEMAIELLDAAIQQNSRAESVWLAQIEILFLARQPARFVECVRAFRAMYPVSAAWTEVARLGRALCADEPLFADGGAARAHAHYGPWPDLPNWIQANWDLTAEIVAADLHRAMRRRAQRAAA